MRGCVGLRGDGGAWGIVHLSVKLILVNMEGICYVVPILPGILSDLLAGRRATVAAAVETVAAVAEVMANQSIRWEPLGGAQGCGRSKMRTCPPCPFVTGRTCQKSWLVPPPHPARTCSLQEMALVRGVMGGM